MWICIQALSAPFEASLVESSLGQCAVRKPETLNIDVTLSEFCEFRWCIVALLPWDKSSHICLSLIQAKQEWQRPEEGNIINFVVDGSLDLWCFDVLQDSDLDTVQGALRSRIQAKVTETVYETPSSKESTTKTLWTSRDGPTAPEIVLKTLNKLTSYEQAKWPNNKVRWSFASQLLRETLWTHCNILYLI